VRQEEQVMLVEGFSEPEMESIWILAAYSSLSEREE
jgi:hypothetical protein